MYHQSVVTKSQIRQFCRRIAKDYHPQKVVLFGSHANGKPNGDSDVDLLVILPFTGEPVDRSVEMRLKLRPPFPVDLLVRTPEMIARRLKMGDPFMREIVEHGKVMYERPVH